MFRIRIGGSGSREPNQCISLRIRILILVRICCHKKLDFDMKNIRVGRTPYQPTEVPVPDNFKKLEIGCICYFWSISLFPDPDFIPIPTTDPGPDPVEPSPHQCGSIRNRNTDLHACLIFTDFSKKKSDLRNRIGFGAGK